MKTPLRVTTVIVSYNTCDELLRCVSSLRASEDLPCEIIVVDNASSDGSSQALRGSFPEVRLIENTVNLGFARACNQGIREAHSPFVLLLNSDAEIRSGALGALVGLLESRPGVGILGPRTVNGDGTIQVSFGPDLTPVSEWRQRRLVRGVRRREPGALRRAQRMTEAEHEPAWVSASCLLARREVFEAVGGLDEGFFLYEEDVDLCVRVRRAGWRVLFTPEVDVVHHLGRSMSRTPMRASLEYHKSHLRYYEKHRGILERTTLKLVLMASSLWGWVRALGPGEARLHRRRLYGEVLRLAWARGSGTQKPLA